MFAERTYQAAFEYLGIPVGTEYGCTFIESGVLTPLLNGVVGFDCPEDLEEKAIQEISRHFQKRGLPHMWLIPSQRHQRGVIELLQQQKLSLQGKFFCMQLHASNSIASAGLSIERVHDGRLFDEWALQLCSNFAMEEDAAKAFAKLLLRGGLTGSFHHLAGIFDGKMVSTASVLLQPQGAYIFNLTTQPEYRRRGFATAMMQRCIECACSFGKMEIALFSSQEAVSLYQKLGFTCVNSYEVYMSFT